MAERLQILEKEAIELAGESFNLQSPKQLQFILYEKHQLPILQKTKDAYLLWYQYYSIIPKIHRYSLGKKIDNIL